jgi:molybdenum cofactor guanylyltransferase
MNPVSATQITGLVLAGGRGSRMGGVDKGLQNFKGLPLALHTLLRLQQQVGSVVINANRNLGAYEAFGAEVVLDTPPDFAGPLAGFLSGLVNCPTPWMVAVPCDTPNFPIDLAERLWQTVDSQQADIAYAVTLEDGQEQRHPVFCLMATRLADSLMQFMDGGGRKIDAWFAQHQAVGVRFDDAAAFANANTVEELARLQA